MRLVCPSCLAVNRVARERLADGPVCGKCRARLVANRPVALDDQTFDRYVGRGDLPVLVDFWADWCPPCRLMAPVLDELASQRSDVCVAKVDTANGQSVAARYRIRSIPTLVLLLRGREIARFSGAVPASQLLDWLERSLAGQPKRDAP
ncbi:MAG: thioredoxin TrxC [Gammaproteobacteria bacterium]|nr:thioredoxin TrxC [Gammaproteobacteria bacterium]